MRPGSIASIDPCGSRIIPEAFATVMARISRRAQAAVAGWTGDDLSCPRVDPEVVARAMFRYLALRGEPAKPMHWFAGGRSARAYMDERGARRQPLPAYWTDIRFAAALDRAWADSGGLDPSKARQDPKVTAGIALAQDQVRRRPRDSVATRV